MGWNYKTLDQLGIIARGKSKHRPRNDKILFGGKYPFIQTADVKSAGLYLTEYTETYNDKGLSQSKLWPVGTLCITIAANIADTTILGIDACFPDSVMGFIPFENIANVKFVKYAFDILQRDCKKISQGTAQDNLSWKKLSTIKFPAPPIEVQNQIVNILSSYDDLIENNKKQIKLLEESAQRLYKEWFVDFRFPGHENVAIVDGIPEGWRKGVLGEIGSFVKGKIITKKSAIKGNVPVVAGGKEPAYYHDKYNTSSPVVTVSASGNAGFVKIYYQKIWASDCSFLDNDMTNDLYFIYSCLKNRQKDLYSMQKGACQQHVNNDEINSIKILIPINDILICFKKNIQPVFEKIKNLSQQIILLHEARDRMLPKLMNGEIEI